MHKIIKAISRHGVHLCLLVVFLFSGCIENRHTLRIAVDRMPEQLDPILSLEPVGRRVAAHLYESLFRQNEEGKILPHLASEGVYDSSQTRLTIHIREGVLFHDGDGLTAHDVVYSIQRILDITKEGQPRVETSPDQLGRPLTIQAVDDMTLEIVLSAPHYSLLRTLTTPFFTPIIKNGTGQSPDHAPPIGTGPYRVKHFSPGRGTTILEKNDQYWGIQGIPDRIIFRAYDNDDERIDAIRAEKADIALNVGISSVARVNSYSDVMQLELVTRRGWLVLGINNQRPPFDDVNMRRALARALNTEEIVRERWGRAGVVMRLFIGEGLEPGYRGPPAPTFNPDRASDYLVHDTTGEVEKLKFLRSMAPNREETERFVYILKENLLKYGLDIEQEYIEPFTAYDEQLRLGEWDLIIDGYSTDNGDLYSFLYDMYGRINPDGSNGLFHMAGDEFMELLRRVNSTIDDDERNRLFRMAIDWIADQVPCIPLADLKSFLVRSNGVDGLDPGPFSDWTFSSVSKEGWQ
ncbi:ABC transporter substrate-binding protein [Gemmatimonadota bacterium]